MIVAPEVVYENMALQGKLSEGLEHEAQLNVAQAGVFLTLFEAV